MTVRHNPMPGMTDLMGLRFGRLIVLSRAQSNYRCDAMWKCLCGCGKSIIVRAWCLRSGNTRSCGCLQREVTALNGLKNKKHGHNRRLGGSRPTPEYRCWRHMINRCENPNVESYKYYGARGIRVHEKWRRDFAAFLRDVGPRPSGKHSIDRIDNDGHYEPGNCRWATAEQQVRNRRKRVL